jgi:hypothetical protein
MLDQTVRALIVGLSRMLPAGLLCYRNGNKDIALSGQAQALALCGIVLDELIAMWSGVDQERPSGNKVLDLFFGRRCVRFDGPGEGSVKAGIQVWLSRFHLDQQAQMPVLKLDEGKAGFALSLGVEMREAPLAKPAPFSRVLIDPEWEATRYRVLQTVSLLSKFFPPLNDYIRAGGSRRIPLSPEALPGFLFDTLPIIRLLGIRILLPKALDRILRPRLSMKISAKRGASPAFINADSLFDFDWTVAIGGKQLTPAEFEKLLQSASGIVRFQGEYVYLDPAQAERLRTQLAKPRQPTGAELLQIALADEYAGAPVTLDENARGIIR